LTYGRELRPACQAEEGKVSGNIFMDGAFGEYIVEVATWMECASFPDADRIRIKEINLSQMFALSTDNT